MQSNNPIFNRSDEFKRGGSAQMSDPSTWSVGGGDSGLKADPTRREASTGPMTIDSVVQKTGISIAVVIVVAALTWILTPDPATGADTGPLIAALTIGSLGAFALSMVNSFKRVISPALVLAFAALEGLALGGLSKIFNAAYEGVVMNAVIGTFFAFGATLAVYKYANIQVGQRFRTFVTAAVFGMVGLSLVSLVLSFAGINTGLFGAGPLGAIFAIAGLALGVFMLIMDFDFVEQGIANRLPERESWRAAFAMTVSLVWIYTNLLRLLAIFSDN